MTTDSVIFHGSNRTDIDEFVPQRASMELNDTGGRGNHGAIYGTHDGLWAMFFAIIDRGRLRGSIRNGSTRYETPDRTQSVDRYHFSVHHEMLESAPYTTGALYLLPRAAFDRVPIYPGGPLSNEWACHEPIRPLARLTIAPEDFPFSIGGHDDGPLLVLDDLGTQVYEGVTSARRTEQGFEIVTSTDRGVIDRFVDLSHEFYPDVSRVAEATDGGTRVEMTGPPAFLHGTEKRLGRYLRRTRFRARASGLLDDVDGGLEVELGTHRATHQTGPFGLLDQAQRPIRLPRIRDRDLRAKRHGFDSVQTVLVAGEVADGVVRVGDDFELREVGDGAERRHQAARHGRHEQMLGAPHRLGATELGGRRHVEGRECVLIGGHDAGLGPGSFDVQHVVV